MQARTLYSSFFAATLGWAFALPSQAQVPTPVPSVEALSAPTSTTVPSDRNAFSELEKYTAGLAEFAGPSAGSYALSINVMAKSYAALREDPLAVIPLDSCTGLEEASAQWMVNRLATSLSPAGRRGELRAQFESARACSSVELRDEALRNLGSALTTVRGDTWDAKTQVSFIRFTTVDAKNSLRGLDARYALPLLEMLFDIADYQAMDRVLSMVSPRTAAADFERYRTIVASQQSFEVANDLPRDCKASLEGEALRGGPLRLRAGSRILSCEGADHARVISLNASIKRLSEAPVLFEFPLAKE